MINLLYSFIVLVLVWCIATFIAKQVQAAPYVYTAINVIAALIALVLVLAFFGIYLPVPK